MRSVNLKIRSVKLENPLSKTEKSAQIKKKSAEKNEKIRSLNM
jgi:hypothetical protein